MSKAQSAPSTVRTTGEPFYRQSPGIWWGPAERLRSTMTMTIPYSTFSQDRSMALRDLFTWALTRVAESHCSGRRDIVRELPAARDALWEVAL